MANCLHEMAGHGRVTGTVWRDAQLAHPTTGHRNINIIQRAQKDLQLPSGKGCQDDISIKPLPGNDRQQPGRRRGGSDRCWCWFVGMPGSVRNETNTTTRDKGLYVCLPATTYMSGRQTASPAQHQHNETSTWYTRWSYRSATDKQTEHSLQSYVYS